MQEPKAKPKIQISMQEYKRYEAKLRRMCRPTSKRGHLSVSPEVADKWKCLKQRKTLISALISCAGDEDLEGWGYSICVHSSVHDSLVCKHVCMQEKFNSKMSIIISSKTEGELKVRSGFYTEKRMIEELNFSRLAQAHLDPTSLCQQCWRITSCVCCSGSGQRRSRRTAPRQPSGSRNFPGLLQC